MKLVPRPWRKKEDTRDKRERIVAAIKGKNPAEINKGFRWGQSERVSFGQGKKDKKKTEGKKEG